MNLYEFEGKQLFEKYGIPIPKGIVVRRGEDYDDLGIGDVVVKAQVLSGKRGKNNGIRFCSSALDVQNVVQELFKMEIRGQYVAAVRVEQKLDIQKEHYLSITYDTNKKQPVLVYSAEGGVDIEDVADEKIIRILLDVRDESMASVFAESNESIPIDIKEIARTLWECFLHEDTRLVEINPLVETPDGIYIAADAKVALDGDAFFRHKERTFEPRTELGRLPTDREIAVTKVDEGDDWYRGTAGKYIEMDGDIAILFSGGGASIANMDALMNVGLKPANYTEYSGNPPREKVAALSKIVLSKPELKGLWIAGGVANFTNVKETFLGIIDALDEIKPSYPIVIRRAGPFGKEGFDLMKECGERNGLDITMFGGEVSMGETAKILADKIVSDV